MIIEDGTGSGNKVKVTGNRLQVAREDEALNATLNGDAYILHIDAVTIDTADYLIALMINGDTAERDMIVTQIVISPNTSDDDGCVEVNLGGTFTSTVANSTATTPFNQKSGCIKEAGGSYYVNDGSGDMTTEANAYVGYSQKKGIKNTPMNMRVAGGWVIPFGSSISVSADKDDKFFGCMHFYFRDA